MKKKRGRPLREEWKKKRKKLKKEERRRKPVREQEVLQHQHEQIEDEWWQE